jgi:hypothetical protein
MSSKQYTALFFLGIGKYIKRFCGDLPNDETSYEGYKVEEYNIFLENHVIEHESFPAELDNLNISQEIYLKYLINSYEDGRCAWLNQVPKGLMHVHTALDYEDIQDSADISCLKNLQLFEPTTSHAEEWWTNLENHLRAIRNEELKEIGRKGENIAFKFEQKRLGPDAMIEKTFLYDNMAGFDLLSFVDTSFDDRMFIEVKSTTGGINSKAYISKLEWKKATQNQNSYFFYFILINEMRIARLSFDQILPHSSQEQGDGKTEKFSVPFKTFEEQFCQIL